MTFNFDELIDRSHTDSLKWHKYQGRNVIPLWVADSDFRSPPQVIDALQQRVAQGIFGYGAPPDELTQLIVERMAQRYQWQIQPDWVVWLPGLVCALELAVRTCTNPSQRCLMPSPIYPPFMKAGQRDGRTICKIPLQLQQQRWVADFSSLDAQLDGSEKLLMLCNPQNPGGTVYRHEELLQQHDFARRHNLWVCSDEIHCDLLLEPGIRHYPFATLNPDAEQRTITLMAPSKTFNLAGLGTSMAIIPNPQLRRNFIRTSQGIVPHINILGFTAALAAYRDGEAWLQQQLHYLRGNRDLAVARINAMPGLSMFAQQGTYLGWIDARKLPVENPQLFFVQAGVGLSSGDDFDAPGFVRINLACPQALLLQALERMDKATHALMH